MNVANKGEWSEIYALFKILADKCLPAADMNLEPTQDSYAFLKVFREDTPGMKYTYNLETKNEVAVMDSEGATVKIISTEDLPIKTANILRRIKAAGTSTFNIPEADDLMDEYLLKKIKAASTQKADIVALVRDRVTGSAELGFSIKSQLGEASTLLNASYHTNFTYKITGLTASPEEINSIDTKSKIRDRLHAIINSGGDVQFSHVDSDMFTWNLSTIDSLMPIFLANMLVEYYLGHGPTVSELCNIVGSKTINGINTESLSFKIKQFLRATALGMVPSKKWNTKLSTYGGYIVVKEDGAVLCYHLYNDDDFKEYLFRNTRLETPGSKRHGFGKIYSENGELYIKLNLQVRFIS